MAKKTTKRRRATTRAQKTGVKRPAKRAPKRTRAARPAAARARSQRPATPRAGESSSAGQPPSPGTSSVELEAAVLRRLLQHFDERKDVQNIELMILAGFCRNCLSRWMVEAAQERGVELDMERAREKVYGMPYSEWKERHQPQATDEQLARFADAEKRAAERRAAKSSAKSPAKN